MMAEYGNYRHAINTTGMTFTTDVEENESGVPIRMNWMANLEGRLRNPTPADPSALDPIIAEMQAYYSIPGQNFGLLHDDGRRTQSYFLNSKTIGGIRPKLMAFPNYQGGEYCTYRKFQIAIQFQTLVADTVTYLKFSENLQIDGGGEVYGVKEVNFGPGTRQRLRTHSKCVATQSGSAVGRNVFPDIPQPIWPDALRTTEPRISTSIRPRGSIQTGRYSREECEISWTYEYEWPTRLDGIPHFAIG